MRSKRTREVDARPPSPLPPRDVFFVFFFPPVLSLHPVAIRSNGFLLPFCTHLNDAVMMHHTENQTPTTPTPFVDCFFRFQTTGARRFALQLRTWNLGFQPVPPLRLKQGLMNRNRGLNVTVS